MIPTFLFHHRKFHLRHHRLSGLKDTRVFSMLKCKPFHLFTHR